MTGLHGQLVGDFAPSELDCVEFSFPHWHETRLAVGLTALDHRPTRNPCDYSSDRPIRTVHTHYLTRTSMIGG